MPETTSEWRASMSRLISGYVAMAIGALLLSCLDDGPANWFLIASVLLGLPPLYQSATSPVLRVSPSAIEHIPWHTTSTRRLHVSLFGYKIGGIMDRVAAEDVAGLQWDGTDNIGIRLRNGNVVSVSFYSVPKAERDSARKAILEFVASSARAA